ncbi:hypothetical protein MZE73_14720, partial [Escherichia coli]|nr:hypothetical protein [Escherichia coli]
TVCVVGKMRDLILQLSKSSIYSTKPIGFTSAGGVVQIGLTLMAERFPYAKGKATGIYYSAGSIATFTIPLITAHLSQRSIADIMWFDTAIAAIGFLLALFIGLRSRKKTRHHSLKENVAPGG